MTHAFDPFDESAGTFEGRTFPSEQEWLGLEPPAQGRDLFGPDFVDRTVAALADPTPELLAAYSVPAASPGFVDRTLAALQQDRRTRWRELLARYVAPDPSPQFVARTLRALTENGLSAAGATHRAGARAAARRWVLPLLAAAAVLAVALLLPRDEALPIERRTAEAQPVAFATAYVASPLPALLTVLDRDADPDGLPNSGGDGIVLLLGGAR